MGAIPGLMLFWYCYAAIFSAVEAPSTWPAYTCCVVALVGALSLGRFAYLTTKRAFMSRVADANAATLEEQGAIVARHNTSGRFATMYDDGSSAWLYLSAAAKWDRPIATTWVYNRTDALNQSQLNEFEGRQSPAPAPYADHRATIAAPQQHSWGFSWSADGHSVAIRQNGVPVACILDAKEPGYSTFVTKDAVNCLRWSETCDHLFGSNAT